MSPRATLTCCLFAAGAALSAAAGAEAQLTSKSPFAPPPGSAAAAPAANSPIEYRGYVELRDGREFNLRNPARKAHVWLKMNERSEEFDVTVKQYDSEKEVLTVEHQGKLITLAEPKSKVVSSGAAGQMMPPPLPQLPSNVPPAVTQAVVLNPTPADEQNRLNAVAAEVQRRRALRDQATQQVGQPGVPPAPIPPPPVAPQMAPPQMMERPGNLPGRGGAGTPPRSR
jgi:hypothetical protein